MKSRPILFTAPMARALLDGRKTQTRRICKPHPVLPIEKMEGGWWDDGRDRDIVCPYGQPGDQLWVRESIYRQHQEWDKLCGTEVIRSYYDADQEETKADDWPWKRNRLPSIHCPRGLSRITLEITGIRCERLRQITGPDAHAEGCPYPHPSTFPIEQLAHAHQNTITWYRDLWEQINGTGSWDANPWVWVVEFKRVMP